MAQNGAYRNIAGKTYLLQPRAYTVQIAHSGVAGSTAQNQVNVDPGAHFLLTDVHVTDTNDPTTLAPGVQGQYEGFVQVLDGTQNYQWYNNPIPRSTFARTRDEGYRFPDEIFIQANTRLLVSEQEPPAGALAGTMQITFQGYSLNPVQQ